MKEKVSVVVPIYNVEKYLSKCIESIINQTYSNIEIILVEDGSPDNSGSICDEFAKRDSRIKVIHKKNGGVSSSRNEGIESATGDYICFVDGDDYVMEDYVEYLLSLALKYKCDVSITTDVFTDFDLYQSKDYEELWSAEKATEMILCYRLPIGVYSKIFKREFIIKNVRFSNELVIGEGFNFNTAAFQRANNIAVGHRKIYFYRKDNPTSVTTIYNDKKWKNGLYALEKINNDFVINSKRINKAWKYANWRTHTDAYDLLIIAKAQRKYIDTYKKVHKGIRKGFLLSIGLPVSKKDKLRAFIMMIEPRIIPLMMQLRRKKYKIKVEKKEG